MVQSTVVDWLEALSLRPWMMMKCGQTRDTTPSATNVTRSTGCFLDIPPTSTLFSHFLWVSKLE